MELELPRWYLVTFAFGFGAAVGSFLNVVIARVPKGESIVSPGSRCPQCRKAIAWYDNVPLLSWILLRAKCRGCRLPIPIRYPLVELSVALLAVAVVERISPLPWAIAAFSFLAALVALTYIDVDHWLLPRQITLPFGVLGLAASFLPGGPEPLSSLLGALAGGASLVVVGWVAEKILKKEAMGEGDVWLLGMIGAWLGLAALLPVVLLASLQGSLVGGLLVLLAKRAPPPKPTGDAETDAWEPPSATALPFGPFLALAAAEYLFFGEALVAWYLGLLGAK